MLVVVYYWLGDPGFFMTTPVFPQGLPRHNEIAELSFEQIFSLHEKFDIMLCRRPVKETRKQRTERITAARGLPIESPEWLPVLYLDEHGKRFRQR